MTKIKKSLIITVFNEEFSISGLIDSILVQTERPFEVVIIDGGSKDNTVSVIKDRISKIKNPKFRVYVKRGNRAVGRNEAIRRTSSNIIAITDAGCILDKNWFKNITKPLENNSADVVAGYYKSRAKNIFQKCLVPYVFVMPDRVDPLNFLPATRSMAIKKEVFKKAGGFDEKLSNNEDYEFARRLKSVGFKIKFVRSAIVYWIPRTTITSAFNMFWRFAKGDAEAEILRPKVVLLFFRYLFITALIILYLVSNSYLILNTLYFILLIYIVWAVWKNYKYVNAPLALIYLPIIQFTADAAVLSGTTSGIGNRMEVSWTNWAKTAKRRVPAEEHIVILAVSLLISICLFLTLLIAFPIHYILPATTAINWFTANNYPKQMDYVYIEAGASFISLFTVFLWLIKVWSKIRK